MSDFNTISTTKKPLDPGKRVKYTMGLVLGVDDFEQEQLYLMERDRLHHRALHGYGTVNGLEVSIRDNNGNPMVIVSPGLAVNPKGETICVPENQCAVINEWLTEHQQEVLEHLGSPPSGGSLSLYVVLCYRECETDKVPIPGAPCRSQDDTMVPSRIADHFELSLKLGPPAQLEEEVVRAFGNLLRRIEITDEPQDYLTLEQMQDLVRDLYNEIGSPPELSTPEETSPPGSGDKLYLHPDEAPEILREGFRVWVTDVRPKILEKGRICGELPDEACVLLAQVDVNIDISEDILHVDTDNPGIIINEDNRPILLHARLLQEWLLCGRYSSTIAYTHTFATLFAINPAALRAWVHHPVLLDIPRKAIEVIINGKTINSAFIKQIKETNVFKIEFLLAGNTPPPFKFNNRIEIRFNASKITDKIKSAKTLPKKVEPGKTLLDLLDKKFYDYIDRDGDFLSAYFISNLPSLNDLSDVNASPTDDQVLTWKSGQWIAAVAPTGVTDHGNLSGLDDDDHQQYLLKDGTRALTGNWSAGNNKITSLAEATVNGDAVRFEQAIKVNDNAGGDLSGTYPNPNVIRLQNKPVSDVNPQQNEVLTWNGSKWIPKPVIPLEKIILPLVTIRPIEPTQLELWFHLDVPGNKTAIAGLSNKNIEVLEETENGPHFVRKLEIIRTRKVARNTWELTIGNPTNKSLRFRFDLSKITLGDETREITEPREFRETLGQYAGRSNLHFIGQDNKNIVTVFAQTILER